MEILVCAWALETAWNSRRSGLHKIISILIIWILRPPNYQNLDYSGNSIHDYGDLVLATKFRFKKEGEKSPAMGFRVAVKLPNASTEKGLGTDETDVYGVFLLQKEFHGLTLAGNLGIAILGDPGTAGSPG